MQIENDLILLLKCTTNNEILKLMGNKEYNNKGGSKFKEKSIRLKTSTHTYQNCIIKVKENWAIAIRMLMFFRLLGSLKKAPKNSGELFLFGGLHEIFFELSKNIDSVNKITYELLDEYIINKKEKLDLTTVRSYILRLEEYSQYAKQYFPIQYRINDSIFYDSKEYKKLNLEASKKRRELYLNRFEVRNKNYSFKSIYELARISIVNIEQHNEDFLILGKMFSHFIDSKININKYKHKFIYKYFRMTKHNFSHPEIMSIQNYYKDCYKNKLKFHNTRAYERVIIKVIREIRISCVIIILITTAMRSHELIILERYPKILEDEFLSLNKIVYKTAQNENGFDSIIPIPYITRDAILLLSKFVELKDGQKEGILINNFSNSDIPTSTDFSAEILKFSKKHGIKHTPTAHQLRHAMAFIISFDNKKDGLELARLLLGHTSINMTLHYMGQYNPFILNIIRSKREEESKKLVEILVNEVRDGKELYGTKGEKLLDKIYFSGNYGDDITDFITRDLIALIKKGSLSILQTPVCFCLHDLSKSNEMFCQRGLNIDNFVGREPIPSRCIGEECKNSIFTESAIEKLRIERNIDSELQERLMKNTFFADSGGFNNSPFRKIINKFEITKKKV
jgi:hypothetical protein